MKNRVSICVIAKNEEKYIERCLLSLLRNQTIHPDEVVVLIHNSSDGTGKIVEELSEVYYQIKPVCFTGKDGIPTAREEAIKNATGDIILCIDGDSYASPNWIEVMTKKLIEEKPILVGSWVKFRGTLFGFLGNLTNYFTCVADKNPYQWIWGCSFGFVKETKNEITRLLRSSSSYAKVLNLSRNPEDYFIAYYFAVIKNKKVAVTNKTFVIQNTKEKNSISFIKRTIENVRNSKTINQKYNEFLV